MKPHKEHPMEQVKEFFRLIPKGKLVVEGKGRTFARVPLWLVIVAALAGRRAIRFAVLTAVLVVAFGMEARLERN